MQACSLECPAPAIDGGNSRSACTGECPPDQQAAARRHSPRSTLRPNSLSSNEDLSVSDAQMPRREAERAEQMPRREAERLKRMSELALAQRDAWNNRHSIPIEQLCSLGAQSQQFWVEDLAALDHLAHARTWDKKSRR